MTDSKIHAQQMGALYFLDVNHISTVHDTEIGSIFMPRRKIQQERTRNLCHLQTIRTLGSQFKKFEG